ncbi:MULTISPECIES: SDR family oxidoreductase [unclassified Exiguobacterium]|uniref:Short-chain dehydrogenase/reductase SDR n=1 Tax=Exiguobacterium sp. (strain ATCC BAA-1283 / AT1b) TaxID=360911 RepID=C4L503_EXISA|nr:MULTISPECIES: SDR family oxidoreductase [unclassified Exiguobacterium]ACQ69748.1 short-chain dehydrogenase/reductase SDR [Exiguobacterium sp. AT1b]
MRDNRLNTVGSRKDFEAFKKKAQEQAHQPGIDSKMEPFPIYEREDYKGSDKLKDKVAIITGGDSGIGKSVAIFFAHEGANSVIVYKDQNELEDAEATKERIEDLGQACLLLQGDLGESSFCQRVVEETLETFGRIDILVNNAAEQHPQESLLDISDEQLEKTFRTNIFSMFYLTKAALPYLKEGASIINTTSITAYEGNDQLIDYASTKGAITAFTRSLAKNLADKKIRVNGVAPGPIWTPLIPSTFDAEKVKSFGDSSEMKRPGQPAELAPAYVYLASDDSTYVSGQVIHVNGGTVING